MSAEKVGEEGSGDLSQGKFSAEFEEPAPPPPPPPPDVTLVEDGFGILPSSKRSSKLYREPSRPVFVQHAAREPVAEEEEEEHRSPCASSTNIDIVRRYTWTTINRMTVQVITYGAAFTSIQVPDKKGNPDDVIAGFDNLEGYLEASNPYFGASIGRFANIIRDGTMNVRPSGRVYTLSTNRGRHHYHGGHIGFDKVNWRSYMQGTKVILSHVSERYSEGYPGTLLAQITIDVTVDNTIKIDFKCTCNEPTVVNLSYQPYFNLAGHHSGPEEMYRHIVTINADKYTPLDDQLNITGQKKVVGGTAYDFRVPRMLSVMIPKIPLGGYDVNYCVTHGTDQALTFVARVLHPQTGRVLEVYSNQPGVQFYTGNLLPDPNRIIEGGSVQGSEEGEDEGEARGELEGEMMGEAEGEENLAAAEQGAVEEPGRGKQEVGGEGGDSSAEDEESEGMSGFGYVPLIGKQGIHYKKHGLFCLMPQKYPDSVNHGNFPSPVLNPGEVYHHQMQYKFGLLLGNYL